VETKGNIHRLTERMEAMLAKEKMEINYGDGQDKTATGVQVKDPVKATTKGGIRKSKKTSSTRHHYANATQVGHTVKTGPRIQQEDIC